jgi:hypothetical protein
LVGVLDPEPVGSYLYDKAGVSCHVLVYRMHVTDAVEEYPERVFRRREWVSFNEALLRIEEPGLRAVLRGVLSSKAG